MSATTPDMGKPQFSSHSWLEPLVVVSIMIGSLVLNRRKNYSIFGNRAIDERNPRGYFDSIDEVRGQSPNPSKAERVCGIPITTPDSTRWANHIHSRILYKFPFLVEMFYWAVNFLFYSVTKATAQWLVPAQVGVVEVAQRHGEDILWFEHESIFRWMFPILESDFQGYFLGSHPAIMTFFNRIYSLVHIPGTVLFISWYYHEAPNANTFALVRRTMTLGNFFAFAVFCVYPCMPPRLLPESYHFFDTVRQEHAESVWVDSKSVNQFAAMPSLHFTYAFVISSTFLYHSEIFRRLRGKPVRKSTLTQVIYTVLAFAYSLLVLSVIVATANHYWLDAVMAIISVTVCFMINRVFLLLLPVEYCLCWVLRLAKPPPNVGGNKSDELSGTESPRYRSVPGYDVV
ncbi:uncharacterized protein N7458_010222 [Penicillium daleae]|uniref:Inositolphosphotransferase Aur1/Ipt1 domain-containing protein n=1 Tax=Penicillium daleae TaxID=63821 RepID=A0AAD6C166_9EURO|nr:uncharacterized protein N7458_010222 [Penicillium daleae]KAJ5439224.1 hypothetical protein N7458_010222 [Penicillium daleae]